MTIVQQDTITLTLSAGEIVYYETEFLHAPAGNEPGCDEDVSFPQPRRFLAQTVQPLEAARLHPCRSLADTARMKIKGSSHANHYETWKMRLVPGHPALLFWRTDADEQDIGIRVR